MNVLIINAGSSSLKYQLMNPETGDVAAKGLCERIYIDGRLTHKVGDKKVVKDIPMPTHSEAIAAVLDILVDPVDGVIKSVDEIDAVGHRVLHGGMEFSDSCIINDEVIKAIEKCIPLGPLHNPANLMGIRACQAVMPNTPQVAVFDTAFHMTMPPRPTATPFPRSTTRMTTSAATASTALPISTWQSAPRSWLARRTSRWSTAIWATAPLCPPSRTASAWIPPWA